MWLAREAGRDRPRAPSRLAEVLWRFDANVTRSFAWTALFFTTIGFIILRLRGDAVTAPVVTTPRRV